jgi:hypothetical protein
MLYILTNYIIVCLQEVVQLAGTTPHEMEVTSSNLPSPLLCGHVKKKKLYNHLQGVALGVSTWFGFPVFGQNRESELRYPDTRSSNCFFFFKKKRLLFGLILGIGPKISLFFFFHKLAIF